jgi:hypothetical protein
MLPLASGVYLTGNLFSFPLLNRTIFWRIATPGKLIGSLFLILILAQWIRNVAFDNRLYTNALMTDRLIEACEPKPVNQPDGKIIQLSPGKWYLIDEYSFLTNPPYRKFEVEQSVKSVQATQNAGKIAYRCMDKLEANFKAEFLARDYKFNYPDQLVIRPDDVEEKRPFFR